MSITDEQWNDLKARVEKIERYVDVPAQWVLGDAVLSDRFAPAVPGGSGAGRAQPPPPLALTGSAPRRELDPIRSHPDLLGSSATLPRLNPLLLAGFAMGGASALGARLPVTPGPAPARGVPDEQLLLVQRTADDDAILLSNLSYLSMVMSEHYKKAAQHVQQVLTEKDAREVTLDGLKWVSKTLFLAGLNAVSAGAAGYLGELLGHAFTHLLDEKLTKDLVDYGTAHAELDKQALLHELHRGLERDQELGPALGEGVYATGELTLEKIAHKLTAGHHHPAEIDATEFFMAQEKALRLLVAKKAAGWSEDHDPARVLVERTRAIWEVIGVAGGGASALQDLLQRKIVSREFEKRLEELEVWLPIYMRRLIWRSYCRSQWHRSTFRYAMKTAGELPEEARGLPASEWPHTVWANTRFGSPARWQQIGQDFQGPEHTAVTDPKVFEEKRWVSMAVVHCCQVHRPSSLAVAGDWLIDLERQERSFKGQAVPHAGLIRGALQDRDPISDYQLLFTDLPDLVPASAGRTISRVDVLRAVHTRGGVVVRIKEMIVADQGIRFRKAAQKVGMGRVDQPGSENTPAVVMVAGQTLIITLVASETLRTPIKVSLTPYGVLGHDRPSSTEEVSFRFAKEQTVQFRIGFDKAPARVRIEKPGEAGTAADRLKETLVLVDPTCWFVNVL